MREGKEGSIESRNRLTPTSASQGETRTRLDLARRDYRNAQSFWRRSLSIGLGLSLSVKSPLSLPFSLPEKRGRDDEFQFFVKSGDYRMET